jgi:hypothetical protein
MTWNTSCLVQSPVSSDTSRSSYTDVKQARTLQPISFGHSNKTSHGAGRACSFIARRCTVYTKHCKFGPV